MTTYIEPKQLNLIRGKKTAHIYNMEAKEFYDQLEEDINLLRDNNITSDPRLNDNNYAFNYWVLSKMYNIDEELIFENIIDGAGDKGLDCFVHHKESKRLFLIQNKYYDENTPLNDSHVSYFLSTPLSELRSDNYKKSSKLQDLYNIIKDDSDYRIYFHLYVTNDLSTKTTDNLFTTFNLENKAKSGKVLLEAKKFNLSDIVNLYYGKQFNDTKLFSTELITNNNGTLLQILPEKREYQLPKNFLEAYYIMTPIKDVYEMYKKADEKKYPLFDENIREFLGMTPINDAIRRTLEADPEEKMNFFYYNNGITIICDKAYKLDIRGGKLPIKLDNPQIVNGCQTVSTVYEVLSNYAKEDPSLAEFKDVYVMIKVLIKNESVKKTKPDIYRDIVKFTNKQNALTEKAFTSDNDIFLNIQKAFRERGFLLTVKGGNLTTFKKEFKGDKKSLNELIHKANEKASKIGISVDKFSDIVIPLDKLLQVFISFEMDGYYAYSKKSDLLEKSNDFYQNHALKIHECLTHDQLLNIWLIFKKAEADRKANETDNKKVPIPFYVLGFLGAFVHNKDQKNNIRRFANSFFSQSTVDILKQYDFLCDLTGNYKTAFLNDKKAEYNEMIKMSIDSDILWKEIEKLNGQKAYKDIKKVVESLNH